MPKEPRTARLIPVRIGNRNYYDRKHWRWYALVSWDRRILYSGRIACTAYHRRKKDAVACAANKLKRLGVKPENIKLCDSEDRESGDWVGTECLWCGQVNPEEAAERKARRG
ncbi:MAG: hypothetical protein V3W37_10005 [Candidatus Binatia bacterium]